MIRNLFIVLLTGVIIFTPGCKKDGPSESSPNDTTQIITKSPKRGISYNLIDPKDLAALQPGISWWYNWGKTTYAPAGYYDSYKMDYVPMLWGGNTSSSDISAVEDFIKKHPEVNYLLVLNEPNLTDQANRTPQQAAVDWIKYEQVISDLEAQGRKIYLVGPQMNYGTMANYSDPVKWLDDFILAYRNNNGGRGPHIDYLGFHWYDYGLAAQLDRLDKYGLKIWITEMANWNSAVNSYTKQKEQMKDMVSICEIREDVFRYAWFIGRGNFPDQKYTYLFTQNAGELSELGKYYLSLPYIK